MKLKCCGCGIDVSTEVPDGTIVRAWIECPDCIVKANESEKRDAGKNRESDNR
jgi:hypothetical protein